jgi:hypothetical protein
MTPSSILKTLTLAAATVLLSAGASFAQQQVNLTATATTLTLPDGNTVPMWGYTCGTPVTGSSASCAQLNPAATGWSPIVITIPTTATGGLAVNLTNKLPSPVPTSLVIVGQLGGGLGKTAQTTPSPDHDNMPTTWPIANTGPVFTPPTQGNRVQSFSTEVGTNGTTPLVWASLQAGTYLLESGTHPSIQGPMGLYGMLVVTTSPVTSPATPGIAYPSVPYNAESDLLFSEIDPAQNNAVSTAVAKPGFSESATIGPYQSGPIVSVNVTNSGLGYSCTPNPPPNQLTCNIPVTISGTGSGAVAQAVVDLDPTSSTYTQVTGVQLVPTNTGGSYTSPAPVIAIPPPSGGCSTALTKNNCAAAVAALQLQNNAIAHCSGGASACYPPAVNYTPLYYLINGVAFDKTHASTSLFPSFPAAGVPASTGRVLVRMVNAGLRMHVPSIVGSTTGAAGAAGFSLIAEDGNPLPGMPRVQSEVFMAAGKTYDVMINGPAAGAKALPVFDRELSLSGNATARDAGMLAYISVNAAGLPSDPAFASAVANADAYSVVPGNMLMISDMTKGVIGNDFNVFGVKVVSGPTSGTLSLNSNGTFTFTPPAEWAASSTDAFVYAANGAMTCQSPLTSPGPCATVSLAGQAAELGSGISVNDKAFTSAISTFLSIKSPGILATGGIADKDAAGYPLTVYAPSITATGGNPLGPCPAGVTTSCVAVDAAGGFNAYVPAAGVYHFSYKAQNAQGTLSTSAATVTLTFPTASGLQVSVQDGKTGTPVADYRWVIEEDRTFYIDPTKTTNTGGSTTVPTFGTNFHTSYMPVVATGCVGTLACEAGQTIGGNKVVCDIGNGVCEAGAQQKELDPKYVNLDPTKRYYISVLPGDAGNPFIAGNGSACLATTDPNYDSTSCGHGMGGAQVNFPAANASVKILVQPTPFPPSKLSVFVFEDDFPLNGEQDAGGGVDVLAPNEPGLGGFNITLFDDAGGTGDATGQMTYDMFNQPLVNSLAGTPDPANHNVDACPISKNSRDSSDPTSTGITGTIVTCPKYEADGTTLSPLAGQAVVANLMPGRYGVVATPAADRIAKGEEWLQTNTLDGQKAHDSFLRIGEPSFFQEYGPAGYHVTIGFANPKIINARLKSVCNGTDINVTGTNCTNSVSGLVTTERMSRTPDQRLYSSGSNDSFAFTQCYVSIGDPDGEDFAFTKCNGDGTFSMSGLPNGSWRITVFDQWNDMLVDGLSTPVLLGGGKNTDMGQIAMNQWQANLYTKTFFDTNKNGIQDPGEPGLTLVPTNIRFRDGSYSNFNNTDLSGNAGFNEEFPLFSWYVVESDTTRYKNTGTHVVYDAGGPADGTPCGASVTPPTAPCGTSMIGTNYANTIEQVPVPTSLRVPGGRYCKSADCPTGDSSGGSTGRIDPPYVYTEGWQGFSGQNSFIEFGKTPFASGENGGVHGEVIYASTRPFDDPGLLIHTSWTPDVPNVTVNLYQEGTAPDGTTSLKLVDTTFTSSWDDWAQGFRSDHIPNMNCPGQTTADLFYFTLFNQPQWLDLYNMLHGGGLTTALPNNSQFKCYDGLHTFNQIQPAPYDGRYQFPSIAGRNPTTGGPIGGTGTVAGTNCTICIANPVDGTPMSPSLGQIGSDGKIATGKYVVEMVVPPGYELVKEEDKNILIGDNYIAPVTQEFGGLGSVFILPDQAEVGAAYNSTNPQNPTQSFGRSTLPSNEGDTGSVETFWPCVGESRIVPDFISLYPQSLEVAPFAGAKRNLCDRKEITLDDQASVLAKFWVFTSAHVAAHFTGVITDDFTSEFDPFSPQFGEKFSPANLPISIKDWTGTEISRVYTDQWGAYNGLTYSTWEVNPPNPTGYAPTMMVTCMNDPGTGSIPDPLYNPAYSQFCYEIPFMPGQTQYMDTPVVPTSAFVGAGYNNPDCAYPDATPAIKQVRGDDIGPWVLTSAHAITITALGDKAVNNNAYAGPSATTAPYNQKTITRHYGFGTTAGTVTIGGKTAIVNPGDWTDSQIIAYVPSGVSPCAIQQQAQYAPGATPALCGQLVITAANGKQSIDTVTVTIGGKAPKHVPTDYPTIQTAIDQSAPGDLVIVNPGTYTEFLLMWKPVRLQGVGAASSVLNANTHPAGKLDPWRAQVNCLFGLALNGQPYTGNANSSGVGGGANPYDATGASNCPGTGWQQFTGKPNQPQVDRLPLEGILGWDTTVNGNLAQLLQEPTLMGAYEGAGITVLSKGVNIPAGAVDIFGSGAESAFPAGTTLLQNVPGISTDHCNDAVNPYPSNFQCNPSMIDGLSVTNSSQGGGGILVHAWGHNLQIANNRIYNNSGTLTGGITVGQGESPDAYLGGGSTTDSDPGSCVVDNSALDTTVQLPYCFDKNVNIHNNMVTTNSSIGDELFSSTPAGAGGVTLCTGADYYQFNYNWVCGNLSTGDGGGLVHLGFIYNGDIEHNSILFNQSTNPTVPTNGGGIIVMGAPPDGVTAAGIECGGTNADADCVPGLSDGTGPNLNINANLIMGNSAESGSGGGLRLQGVNGTEVTLNNILPGRWNNVSITNNIIANNVAGWDGAGISLQDALKVSIVNNTIISNDTTASSGVLFNTLGAPLASSTGPTSATYQGTSSLPQVAGLVSTGNSPQLVSGLPSRVLCPLGEPNCTKISNPLLYNNVIWHNRAFYIGVGPLGTGSLDQQNVVSLFNAFTSMQAPSQPQADATTAIGNGVMITGGTGACPASSYWDIGVRGDLGPANHNSGFTLSPNYSILTDAAADYPNNNNQGTDPQVISLYCNGSRVPPELGKMGYQVPAGISDATVPNPIFNLTPAATVDEGNNWVNLSWGPLSESNPVTGSTLGNYALGGCEHVARMDRNLIDGRRSRWSRQPLPSTPWRQPLARIMSA